MKHEITFVQQSFMNKMMVHAYIGKLRAMQLNAHVMGYDTEWIDEEIADLTKTLKEWEV